MVKNLAVIPARSGSKRIPDKNIYSFMGKPLLVWTIETALKSGVFTDVIVSTDSKRYAEIAKEAGASVPFLRDEACDDFASIADVVRTTLNRIKKEIGTVYDYVATMQVTCPLCTAEIVKEVYHNFEQRKEIKTLMTCFEFGFMNPYWAFKMNNGEADFVLSCPEKSRSQDNTRLYCPTGAVVFHRINGYTDEKTKYYPIDWKYAVDIDNYEDIEMAEAIFNMLHKKQ